LNRQGIGRLVPRKEIYEQELKEMTARNPRKEKERKGDRSKKCNIASGEGKKTAKGENRGSCEASRKRQRNE